MINHLFYDVQDDPEIEVEEKIVYSGLGRGTKLTCKVYSK